MCLATNPIRNQQLLNDGKKVYKFYKFLALKGSRLVAPYRGTKYASGWKKAKNCVKPDFDRYQEIRPGIHLYEEKSKAQAKIDARYSFNTTRLEVAVEFTCYKTDLLGVGYDEVAFKKVFLTKREYNRALRKALTIKKNRERRNAK